MRGMVTHGRRGQTGASHPTFVPRASSARRVKVLVVTANVLAPTIASWKWYCDAVRDFATQCGPGELNMRVMAQFRRLGVTFDRLMARARGILHRPVDEEVPVASFVRDVRVFATNFRAFRAMQWDALGTAPQLLHGEMVKVLVCLSAKLATIREALEHPHALTTMLAQRNSISSLERVVKVIGCAAKRGNVEPVEFEVIVAGVWDLLESVEGLSMIDGYFRLRRDLRHLCEDLSRLWGSCQQIVGGGGSDLVAGGERLAADINRVLAEAGVRIRIPVRWHRVYPNVSVRGASEPESESEMGDSSLEVSKVDQVRLCLKEVVNCVDEAVRILSSRPS